MPWQLAHALSSVWTPPEWKHAAEFTGESVPHLGSPWSAAAKWTWSWHDVHTACVLPIVVSSVWSWGVPFVAIVVSWASGESGGSYVVGTWHMTQLATPWGMVPGKSSGLPGAPPVAAFAALNS